VVDGGEGGWAGGGWLVRIGRWALVVTNERERKMRW
jgi:hypothetical protein